MKTERVYDSSGRSYPHRNSEEKAVCEILARWKLGPILNFDMIEARPAPGGWWLVCKTEGSYFYFESTAGPGHVRNVVTWSMENELRKRQKA
jgi:hypothetical protein